MDPVFAIGDAKNLGFRLILQKVENDHGVSINNPVPRKKNQDQNQKKEIRNVQKEGHSRHQDKSDKTLPSPQT